MSLLVDLFDPEQGPYAYLNAMEDDAAGFEVYRTQVWSAQPLTARGARFLPQLSDADLFVYPDQLDDFERECTMIRSQAPHIAAELSGGPTDASLQAYMARFLRAIALARARGAGVCIT